MTEARAQTAAPAAAQNDVSGIEEIIVTARKREESLQDVAASIQALTGADLKQQGLVNMEDVVRFLPNVNHVGGISALWKVAAMAEASGIQMAPHACEGPIGGIATVHVDAQDGDFVSVHYRGTLEEDGSQFDSSYDRGEPAVFPVTGVIAGWTEVLQLMPVGSKWEVYIPGELAYGERGAGNRIPPNSTLIFEVELLEIQEI